MELSTPKGPIISHRCGTCLYRSHGDETVSPNGNALHSRNPELPFRAQIHYFSAFCIPCPSRETVRATGGSVRALGEACCPAHVVLLPTSGKHFGATVMNRNCTPPPRKSQSSADEGNAAPWQPLQGLNHLGTRVAAFAAAEVRAMLRTALRRFLHVPGEGIDDDAAMLQLADLALEEGSIRLAIEHYCRVRSVIHRGPQGGDGSCIDLVKSLPLPAPHMAAGGHEDRHPGPQPGDNQAHVRQPQGAGSCYIRPDASTHNSSLGSFSGRVCQMGVYWCRLQASHCQPQRSCRT